MFVQSILFDKAYFTFPQATAWLQRHHKIHSKVDSTQHYWRFRQRVPEHGARYVTHEIATGIKFVMMN